MDELIKLYRKRLVKEAVIKALLSAFVVGLAAVAVCSVIFWFVDFKLVWVSAIVFAVVFGGAAPAFYFLKFRPSEKSVAKRIDKDLGMEERMITSLEFKDSSEVVACAQRANAVSALRMQGVRGTKKIVLKVFTTALAVMLPIAVVFGAGLTTVSALSAADIIPSGADLMKGAPAEAKEYVITYAVQGKGIIFGIPDSETVGGITVYTQVVKEGETAAPVWAIAGAEEGVSYFFAGWSDGNGDPFREDEDIRKDMNLVATFLPADDTPYKPEWNGGENGGENGASPTPPSGGEGDDGDMAPDDNEDKEDSEGGGAGGSSNPAFQVIDGKTDYGGSTYENACEEAQDEVSSSEGMPDDLEEIIKDYMDIIKR